MLAVTSTSAYASIFTVLFPMGRTSAILLGSLVVIAYSCLGGMWSITLTDMMQFLFMTVGIFAILLPFSLSAADGWSGLGERLDATYFSLGGMGCQSIITMFVVYGFGMLIGQDIWQRVLTARSPQVARWGGVLSAVYIGIFGVAGAVIGMAAAVVMPELEVPDDAFARMAVDHVPAGLGGIVLSAGAIAVVIGMIAFGVMANAPIYIGLAVSAVVFVAASLATRPTDPAVLRVWDERLAARESTAPEERASAA